MPLARRRPLLRAAAAGGAAYVERQRRVQRREREVEQDARISNLERGQQAPSRPPAGGLSSESIQRLKAVAELHDQGILNDEEFEREKSKVLAG